MTETDLRLLTQKVISLSKEVGSFLKKEVHQIKNKDVLEKGLHDLVSYVDKTAERTLVSSLKDFLPEAGFITEEGTVVQTDAAYKWIVDPLDGTTNFIHGVPLYSVSIALWHANEVILGVIYEPNLDECFSSWKGGGSFLNGKKISVSETTKVDKALFATGFPYYDYSLMKEYLHFFEYLMKNSRGIRRLGSAAVDMAYVACGRYDGFYEYGLQAWDIAAGSIIVKNAGGQVFDFSGGEKYLFGKEIVGLNSALYEEFIEQIKIHFKR